jgi:tetratricopeptide (TPR) repeat protein
MAERRIIFLSVPESLRGQIEGAPSVEGESGFTINPDIPIPVEIPENENFNLEELSWEMIISGMLRIIAAPLSAKDGPSIEGEFPPALTAKKNETINYYRDFVLTLRPGIMGEFTEAAILKARNGDFDLALEILDTLRGLFPLSPVVKLNRALVMEEQASLLENHDTAETAFNAVEAAYVEALDLDPPFPDAYFNAGFFYLDRKDFCRARECFSQYVEIAEDASLTEGRPSIKDEDKKKQAQAIIRDIEKNGLDDVNISDAYKLIRQGKEDAGMRCIREFIEEHPSVWNGWFVLGWALRRLSRWEDGAAAFRKAVELGGSGCDTRNELAICLMELGDLSGARHELETALRKEPENVKIISNLGVLALKDGKKDEAAAFFRTVLELDPNDPVAKKFL